MDALTLDNDLDNDLASKFREYIQRPGVSLHDMVAWLAENDADWRFSLSVAPARDQEKPGCMYINGVLALSRDEMISPTRNPA